MQLPSTPEVSRLWLGVSTGVFNWLRVGCPFGRHRAGQPDRNRLLSGARRGVQLARNPKVGKKNGLDRRPKLASGGGRPRRGRPKICIFCRDHATWVDYKDVLVLKRFVSDRGKIKNRGVTGTCAQHQRDVAVAIKTARELALMPYAVRISASESRGSRGRGDGGRGVRSGEGGGPPAASSDGEGEDNVAGQGDVDGGANDADEEAVPGEIGDSEVVVDA